jgi:hypothetical protein
MTKYNISINAALAAFMISAGTASADADIQIPVNYQTGDQTLVNSDQSFISTSLTSLEECINHNLSEAFPEAQTAYATINQRTFGTTDLDYTVEWKNADAMRILNGDFQLYTNSKYLSGVEVGIEANDVRIIYPRSSEKEQIYFELSQSFNDLNVTTAGVAFDPQYNAVYMDSTKIRAFVEEINASAEDQPAREMAAKGLEAVAACFPKP